jgi:hypothetical protein
MVGPPGGVLAPLTESRASRLRLGISTLGRPWPWVRTCLVLVGAGLALAVGLRHVWTFTIDDAGISFAYAKHLAEGHGPVPAVGGPFIEGYSNPLWVFLLVPFGWFGAPLDTVAKVLATCLFIGGCLCAMRLIGRTEGRPWFELRWVDALVPITLGLTVEFVVWVPSGLENPLYMALLLALALFDAREHQSSARRPWSAWCAFGLAITRPEGAIYGAMVAGLKVAWAIPRREWRWQAARYVLWFGGALLVYHLVHYAVFRDLLPNTYYAKPRRGDAFGDALDYLVKHGKQSGFHYLLPLAALGLVGNVRVKLGLLLQVTGATVFLLYSGGDWMPHGRFVSFALPALATLSAFGLANASRWLTWPVRAHVSPNPLGLLGVLVLAGFWWKGHAPSLRKVEKRAWCHLCERVVDTKGVKRVQKSLRLPSATLLTHDFGGPAWLSDESLYPMDLMGLCDYTFGRDARAGDVPDLHLLSAELLSWVQVVPGVSRRLLRSWAQRPG